MLTRENFKKWSNLVSFGVYLIRLCLKTFLKIDIFYMKYIDYSYTLAWGILLLSKYLKKCCN